MARQLIDDLIDKPFNELTEEEAEVVIEWKAKKKFEQMKSEANFQLVVDAMKQRCNEHKEVAEAAISALKALEEKANQFYDSQGNE